MNKYTIRRYLLFIISLFINAFGIAFITKAFLGTSPITSVTYPNFNAPKKNQPFFDVFRLRNC